MSDEGLEKSAILLMSLGEDEAAEVLKHLSPKEVQKLGKAMAEMKDVSRDRLTTVLEEFRGKAESKASSLSGSPQQIKAMLTKALGDERAGQLIGRILDGGDTSGIEGLKWMDAQTIAHLVRGEHPQIVAAILVHLEYDQASEVLVQLPENLRNEVVLRIATLDRIQPTALQDLNQVLATLASSGKNTAQQSMGGVKTAAEILNFMGGTIEESVVASLRGHDEELAQKVVDQMFVFDNLIALEDRALQLLLREVQSDPLILALKGASEELRNKIFKNMSQRAAEQMREDLESKGPVRLSEVEGAQKEILKIVRRLAEEGQIVLAGKGEEAFV